MQIRRGRGGKKRSRFHLPACGGNSDCAPKRRLPACGACNTAPGCFARVSTRAPGLRPHGFWSRPGPSDWVSPALTFAEVFHRGLRQFVSTRPLGLAAGVRSGGHKPPLRSRPRQSGLLQNPRHPRQRYVKVCLKVLPAEHAAHPAILWGRILLWGGEEKKLRITEEIKDARRKENCKSWLFSIPCYSDGENEKMHSRKSLNLVKCTEVTGSIKC